MVTCQRGLFVQSDPASLVVIKQMNMARPFIQYQIDEETVVCSGITSKELKAEFFKRLRNAERPKEEMATR
ncbi:REX1 DNA repair domain-containing [Cryptosporidium sp. chipmunk genotype I]|uniref:REX1 DNA repair domain-containing n=1 Tax=Cryptosporidium sp. chipmunk genotype I TaxID=1280935 RepID=UPI00351AA691|nr:REX1 DNA repair domain-containing [Cryptosporidium sp. chipmunk genotype I]